MSKSDKPGIITGKISANPKPVSFGQSNVAFSWETNDPAGSEVHVSTFPGDYHLEALKATFPKSRGGVEAVSGCAEGLRVT